MTRPLVLPFAAALVALAACKAGPSAFDRAKEQVAVGDAAGVAVVVSPSVAESTESPVESEGESGAGSSGPSEQGDAPDPPMGTSSLSGLDAEDEGDELFEDPDARFPRPRKVRGLYVNAWAAGSQTRMDALLDVARRTEINSFVIDIKDASGYLSHRTEIPLAHEIGANEEVRIRNLEGLLDRLETEGIYPIARIVIVKDPILAELRPELAVQDTAGGVWVDGKGLVWLNPYDERVWEYHLDVAREVAELGFPEIQWDYVRFPDAPQSELDQAVFVGADERRKAEVIRDFLQYTREKLDELDVRATADVFGVATSATRDVGIGQHWESMVDMVDALLPMVYPSHYWTGSFGFDEPNAYPYEVVRGALRDAIRRSEAVEGAGKTRPWLQDFTLGAPVYGGPEVRAQIQATYDAGIDEWVLWNPSSRYTETALEPIDGFEEEPMVRVAGGLFPVSRRREVIDSVRAAREAAELLETLDSSESRPPELIEETELIEADTVDVIAPDLMRGDTVGVGR